MSRRVAALALALAILGVPVVAIVCQVTCGSQNTMASEEHQHHHSCPQPSPGSGAALNTVPHACGHQPGEALQRALQLLTVPVLVDDHGSLMPRADVPGVTPCTKNIEHSPPRPLALISQLRV